MAYTKTHTAAQCWTILDGARQGLLRRVENYAKLSIRKVCYPEGYNADTSDEAHDYQSLGAQAVNHISNKLMLAMFAPSRPFAKLQAGSKALATAAKAGLTPGMVEDVLAEGERRAIKELDSREQRPKLFQLMRHLVVAGNALLILEDRGLRVMGVKYYVVKRSIDGTVQELVIREKLKYDELDEDIVSRFRDHYQDGTEVCFYKWIKRIPNGSYTMTQWVDEKKLPKEYDGRWPADKLPYRAVTWDLGDESDYGTGLVEEYVGDFEASSVLSESIVDGAVLGTEYRWLVSPTGQTSVQDMQDSENGDVLPGLPGDVAPTQGGNPKAIEIANVVLDRWERRVARGFLMGSAVIRDAERVTTEEVRLTAQELETAYGGVYSTLAASVQKPVAQWLFKAIKLDLKGADIEINIITGLDALSRNGDLDNFRLAMQDMLSLTTMPPDLSGRIKWEEVTRFVGQGRNIDMARFFLTDAEAADKQQAQAVARAEEAVGTEAGMQAVQQPPQGPQQ